MSVAGGEPRKAYRLLARFTRSCLAAKLRVSLVSDVILAGKEKDWTSVRVASVPKSGCADLCSSLYEAGLASTRDVACLVSKENCAEEATWFTVARQPDVTIDWLRANLGIQNVQLVGSFVCDLAAPIQQERQVASSHVTEGSARHPRSEIVGLDARQ